LLTTINAPHVSPNHIKNLTCGDALCLVDRDNQCPLILIFFFQILVLTPKNSVDQGYTSVDQDMCRNLDFLRFHPVFRYLLT
jgi:hypothetical protein